VTTINSIDPNKSLKSGGTVFTIDGTDFITTDLSNDFSGASFYTDISVGGGSISDTDKLILEVDTTPGSIAGIFPSHTFLLAFDVSILLEEQPSTIPAADNAIIAAVKAVNSIDSTTYYEIQLRYDSFLGYSIHNLAYISGSLEYTKVRSIDPHNVQGLKVVRSGDRFTGYIKISDTFVEMGSYQGYSDFDSNINIYCANNSSGIAGEFSVGVTNYNLTHIVSLANKPAILNTIIATEITGTTQPQDIQTDDLIIGFPDTTTATLASGFSYVESSNIQNVGKLFDIALSIYNYKIDPERSELFFSAKGFTWDQDYWIDPSKQNNNLFVPSLWDPTRANVPTSILQSGHGDYDNLELINIVKRQVMDEETWHPRLKHGTYFIRNVPYYLFSEYSIVTNLTEDKTTDNRSKINLKYPPKVGIPISASTSTIDKASGLTVDLDRFQKRGKFTGKIQNGVELDTDTPSNIDTERKEFIVIYNSNNMCTNYSIPVEGAVAGEYSFTLPKIPLPDFAVIFSRKDIFKEQKTANARYGEGTYNQFSYSSGLISDGDYSINFATGEVRVILDRDYIDLGYVTFTFDYPAVVEFNKDYLEDAGSTIAIPTSSDLDILVEIGESNGEESQKLTLKEFPVLDEGTELYIDNDNFKLFLYNTSENTFDTEWTRVRDLDAYSVNDKVYTLNSNTGKIIFGDGIHGKIPDKYRLILVGYKQSIRVEYEPASASDYWLGKNTDFNFNKSNLNSGFIYLSRKDLIPSNIGLTFSTDEINALEFADLIATVTDIDGEPIPTIELEFEIISGSNSILSEEVVVTDFNGEAKTTFIPSGDVSDLGIFSHLYEEGPPSGVLGDPTEVLTTSGALDNDMLILEEDLVGSISEMYIFKIYDNNDAFTPYSNETRTGGLYLVFYEFNTGSGQNELIRPIEVNGNVLIFDRSLPQPYSISEPNYDADLRGYVIVGQKKVQARASMEVEGEILQSNIASIRVSFSSIQKGEWTLPIFPTTFTGSEISSATYITINP